MSNSLRPHGLQHVRPPCPTPSPKVCPSSFFIELRCCPAISSAHAFFAFCLQSFPESGTFPMSHLFTSDDQNTGVSASPSVLPVNIQGWSPLKLKLVWSPCCPRDFQESSPAPQFYMSMIPKSVSSSRTSLLNTIPFHQLPAWQMEVHLGISEAYLSQHIQTRILHYSLTLKYTALNPLL